MESINGDGILFAVIHIDKHGLGVAKPENVVSTITQHGQRGPVEQTDC